METKPPNYYELLGVKKDATSADIKAAFRKLMKTAHPDVGGTGGMFMIVNEAFETLSDPGRRATYDYELDHPSQTTHEPSPPPKPPQQDSPKPRPGPSTHQTDTQSGHTPGSPSGPPPAPDPTQHPSPNVDPDFVHTVPPVEEAPSIDWKRTFLHLGYVLIVSMLVLFAHTTGFTSFLVGGATDGPAVWLEENVWPNFSPVLVLLVALLVVVGEWFYGVVLNLRLIPSRPVRWLVLSSFISLFMVGEYLYPFSLRAVLVVLILPLGASVFLFVLHKMGLDVS